MRLEPASVRGSVRSYFPANMNISDQWTDRYQILSEASLGWGNASLGFGLDRIGTLVSMATDSSHRVIMGKILLAH